MRHPDSAPPLHRAFLDRAIPLLARDRRIIGVAATGSYAENAMDAFSDLDLVLGCEPADHQSLMQDRRSLAEALGTVVAAFTGEHVGELASTLGALERRALAEALNNAVTLYRELRPSSVTFNLDAERVAMGSLRDVARA